jgi:hypothetical protein
MRVAGHRPAFTLGAFDADASHVPANFVQVTQALLEPQASGHQDLVIAAASRVHFSTQRTQPINQASLNGRVAILEALIQHEGAGAEVGGQHIQFTHKGLTFRVRQQAYSQQSFDMRFARLDVVQEEFPIQQHIIAGKKSHDALIALHAGLLPK